MKIKYLLLSLLAPLLFNFVNAFDLTDDEITYLNNNSLNQGSFNNVSYYNLYYSSAGGDLDFCVVFSGLTSNMTPFYGISPSSNGLTESNGFIYKISYPYFLFCSRADAGDHYVDIYRAIGSNTSMRFSVDHFRFLRADKIVNGYLGFDVQSLLDSYDTCSSNLNQCDTSVQQCLIDKDLLSGSLDSCNQDKASLQLYNNSLSDQLAQCLSSSGSGSFSGSCNEILNYQLFWQDDGSDYSLPITNNLFLPSGYKGRLNEDQVLSIAAINTLETAYQFDQDSKQETINSFALVMLFLIASGLIIVLIRLFRKIFIH